MTSERQALLNPSLYRAVSSDDNDTHLGSNSLCSSDSSYASRSRSRRSSASSTVSTTPTAVHRPSPSAPVSRNPSPSYGATKSADPTAAVTDYVDDEEAERELLLHTGSVRKHATFKEIWPLLMGLASASYCSALGATIVANLQIEIGSHFHAGSLASWLGTAYVLGLTAVTPLYGRLAQHQVLGRRGAMILALALYVGGTTLSAAAPSMYIELTARAVAGAGGGGLMTVTAIIITDLVSLADRGLYQGLLNLLWGAGSASGAVLGGYVSDLFGWRAAFWMQVPPLLFSFVVVVLKVNVRQHKEGVGRRANGEEEEGESMWEKVRGIDWAGTAVLTIAISCLSICSTLLTSRGYSPSHPLPLSLSIITLLAVPAFISIERRATHPILPLDMVVRPQVALILAGCVLTTAANFSRLFMQPLYLHAARGLSASETGILLLPASVGGPIASLYGGWHMRRWKEYKWFQVVISTVPWLQALLIVVGWGLDTAENRLCIEMAVGSIGGGGTLTTLMTSLVAAVEPSELALAISACYLFRAIGQVLGLSLSASLQQVVLSSSLSEKFPSNPSIVRQIIQEPAEVLPTLSQLQQILVREAYMDSIRAVFAFVFVAGVLLTAVCFGVRGRKL